MRICVDLLRVLLCVYCCVCIAVCVLLCVCSYMVSLRIHLSLSLSLSLSLARSLALSLSLFLSSSLSLSPPLKWSAVRRAPPLAGLFLVNQSRTSMHCCTLLLVASHARLTVHARVLRHRCLVSLSNKMLSPAPNPLCLQRVTTCYWPLHACLNVSNVGESSPLLPCMSAFITQQRLKLARQYVILGCAP